MEIISHSKLVLPAGEKKAEVKSNSVFLKLWLKFQAESEVLLGEMIQYKHVNLFPICTTPVWGPW